MEPGFAAYVFAERTVHLSNLPTQALLEEATRSESLNIVDCVESCVEGPLAEEATPGLVISHSGAVAHPLVAMEAL